MKNRFRQHTFHNKGADRREVNGYIRSGEILISHPRGKNRHERRAEARIKRTEIEPPTKQPFEADAMARQFEMRRTVREVRREVDAQPAESPTSSEDEPR